ncbi:hypothetical protein A2Y99_04510 [Candidatus Gottesmanbacteria bacterium RBG_13_37_7]|uniref:Uncharacterized protein n=1 Tax=Candidatus Gottesmanbacteria bacterium RBG_13_37_7 TaxID=1798369 RepID=A0A1F5YGF3_9BACT|nr:MAG: hypothetical protein A2Y99_04510 [Candidatus Gottesmanbacteria bacterium RBG_13_37_7]
MTETRSGVCANIFISPKGGCPAYTETPLQTKGNVGLELGVELGYVPRSELANRQGICSVTEAIVVTENTCSVNRQLFMDWFNTQ